MRTPGSLTAFFANAQTTNTFFLWNPHIEERWAKALHSGGRKSCM
jgi:hypothetical protein